MHKRIPIFLIQININFMEKNLLQKVTVVNEDESGSDSSIILLCEQCNALNQVVIKNCHNPGAIIAALATQAVQRGIEYGMNMHIKMMDAIIRGEKDDAEFNIDANELFGIIQESVADIFLENLKHVK